MKLKSLRWSLAALALLFPASASACPQCQSGIARQVRAGIYDDRFASNLTATALPFGVFLGITATIHFGVPAPWHTHRARRPGR